MSSLEQMRRPVRGGGADHEPGGDRSSFSYQESGAATTQPNRGVEMAPPIGSNTLRTDPISHVTAGLTRRPPFTATGIDLLGADPWDRLREGDSFYIREPGGRQRREALIKVLHAAAEYQQMRRAGRRYVVQVARYGARVWLYRAGDGERD